MRFAWWGCALAALVLFASDGRAGTYFAAADGLLVCPDVQSWADATDPSSGAIKGSDECWRVERDAAFAWDGGDERLATWEPAIIAVHTGRKVVVNPNLLTRSRHQDPFDTDIMVGPAGAVLCPTRAAMSDGVAAITDPAWFSETECIKAPAGALAKRIDPVTPKSASLWRVRYMPDGEPHRTLYGLNGDFVLRSGERIKYTRW